MSKRGRPPHPDILTPREWEVLALLREGLSNEEIAQRLGISLAGAKYHVSEILGKLAVGSREEAAAWQPAERPWWATALAPIGFLWRKTSMSWLSPALAGVLFVAVVAGLGLLVWGLMRTSEHEGWTSVGAPERLAFEPGGVIDVAGIFFLDPNSGEVEGWPILPAGMSADGRLMVERVHFNNGEDNAHSEPPLPCSSPMGNQCDERVFDTKQGKICDSAPYWPTDVLPSYYLPRCTPPLMGWAGESRADLRGDEPDWYVDPVIPSLTALTNGALSPDRKKLLEDLWGPLVRVGGLAVADFEQPWREHRDLTGGDEAVSRMGTGQLSLFRCF